jgi:hypothetical protein
LLGEAENEYTPLNSAFTLCSPSKSSLIAKLVTLFATKEASEEVPAILLIFHGLLL